MHELNAANTTEAWDPSGKPDMSKSHAWGSAAGNIIQRGLMGINPIEPGFKKVSIKPQTGDLRFAEMRLPTIKGEVTVKVSFEPDAYNIEVYIPANITARIYIKKIHDRDMLVDVDDKEVQGELDEDGEYLMFDNIGSGKHIFKRHL
jgi:hypothetical protein